MTRDCGCGCGGGCSPGVGRVLRVRVNGDAVFSQDLGGPKPLYVSRKLLNGAEVSRWARSAGLTDVEDPSEMHVTLVYSRTPVDWMSLPGSWGPQLLVGEGGPRSVEIFGKSGDEVVALRFNSLSLQYRWEELRKAGCSSGWPDYRPHVTVAKGDQDVSQVVPYSGVLEFGPEVFAPIRSH